MRHRINHGTVDEIKITFDLSRPRRRFAESGFLTTSLGTVHHLDLSVKTGIGWFDAPYVRAMLDAESPERMRDIEGPQSDELIRHAGWSFTEEPLHVALVPDRTAALAIAWIAATTRGLNLTYAVAHSAQGKGLATFLTACAVVIYSQQRTSSTSQAGLTVHAQFDQENQASANVAAHLGLVTEPSLSFTVANGNGHRLFVGSEASWLSVLTKAKNVANRVASPSLQWATTLCGGPAAPAAESIC